MIKIALEAEKLKRASNGFFILSLRYFVLLFSGRGKCIFYKERK
jgi:hypothetical protein